MRRLCSLAVRHILSLHSLRGYMNIIDLLFCFLLPLRLYRKYLALQKKKCHTSDITTLRVLKFAWTQPKVGKESKYSNMTKITDKALKHEGEYK